MHITKAGHFLLPA